MYFSFDLLQAAKGDSFLIHYGSKDDPRLILVDGGPDSVYQSFLKPRLAQIRKKRGLSPMNPLMIDLMMVSHIDDDHIQGLLELTGELVEKADSLQPLPYKVLQFWHNTLDDILGKNPADLQLAVTASFGAASLGGEFDTEGLGREAAMVLASVSQGLSLRDNARKLKMDTNSGFADHIVMTRGPKKKVSMGKRLSLTIVGPMKKEILDLKKDYEDFLRKQKEEKESATTLAAYTDTSVPNLSSLVVLAEMNKKRMLLTGDARGDKILKGLETTGLLKAGETLHVNILKAPHHGSFRNLDNDFFRRITADHYVFSGDGEHGNPERETFQALFEERGDAAYTVHLTYPIAEIDVERQKDWQKEQAKEIKRKKKNPNLKVREDWSPAKHSLAGFLEEHEDFAKLVRVLEAGKPHMIDLLDEVD